MVCLRYRSARSCLRDGCGFGRRLFDFAAPVAGGALGFAVALGGDKAAAVGTGLRQGARPGREVAFRVVGAAVEDTAPAGTALEQLATVFRAADASRNGERLAALALGVAGAGEEAAETPALDYHGRAAFGALLVCCLRRFLLLFAFEREGAFALGEARACNETATPAPADEHRLSAFGALHVGGLDLLWSGILGHSKSFLQRLIELLDDRLPAAISACDVVEFILHAGGEADVNEVLKVLDQEVIYDETQIGRLQIAAVLFDVATVLDGGHCRRVSAGARATFLLGRFEGHSFDISRCDVEQGVGHLAGHHSLPDEVVEAELVVVKVPPDGLRLTPDVRWPDGLVRFLSAFDLLGVDACCGREKFAAEALGN